MKIGLLLIATNKYESFLQPLISSADALFFNQNNNDIVEYFIFTNHKNLKLKTSRDYHIIDIEHKPWPYPTLYRYKYFTNNQKILLSNDYLYYCDVDMQFVDYVDREILGTLVGTLHPGFMGGRGTPETNPKSLAYIPDSKPLIYCAGGFNGGLTDNFLSMADTISNNIQIDLKNNIIAIWHDESHMNKYYTEHHPEKILSPSYCYPESSYIPFKKKLLALDKNHLEIRS